MTESPVLDPINLQQTLKSSTDAELGINLCIPYRIRTALGIADWLYNLKLSCPDNRKRTLITNKVQKRSNSHLNDTKGDEVLV